MRLTLAISHNISSTYTPVPRPLETWNKHDEFAGDTGLLSASQYETDPLFEPSCSLAQHKLISEADLNLSPPTPPQKRNQSELLVSALKGL